MSLFALALSAQLAVAAVPKAPPLKLSAHVPKPVGSELCFPSGLRVLTVQRHGTGLAAVTTVIDGGRAEESLETRGAAHLLEHLWFRSAPGGGLPLWDRASGLILDGATYRDATVYSTVGAAADLPGLLALESARLLNPLEGITPEIVSQEKEIVTSELLWRGEHSTRQVDRSLEQALYPSGHPYHESTATVAQVEALTLDAVRAFASHNYVTSNVTIRIELDGVVEQEALASLLEDALPEALRQGSGSECKHPVSGDAPPAPASTAMTQIEAPVWHREVWVAWTTPAGFWADDVLARLAVSVLENIVWQRLPYVRGLRGDAQAALGCSYSPGVWASQVECRVELPPGIDPKDIVASIRSAVPRQWTPSEAELRRELLTWLAPTSFTHALVEADRMDAKALMGRALWSHYGDSPEPVIPVIHQALKVQEPMVSAFAKQWLTADRMAVVVVEPAAPTAAAGKPRHREARLSSPAPSDWAAPTPALHVRERRLENGLTVWVSPQANGPVAFSSLTFRGGSAHAPAGVQEVFENIARYPLPVSLYDLRRRTGTITTTWFAPDAVYSVVRGPVGNLDLQLWALRAKAEAASMDFSERQALLDQRVHGMAEWFVHWPWTTSMAVRLGHLLPDSPASLPWWEEIRAARYVSQGDVLRWQRAVMQPGNATAVITGATPSTDELVERYLGRWKAPRKPVSAPPAPPVPQPSARQVLALPRPAVLSDVILTCRIPGRTAENQAALDVLEGVIERGLWQSLREDGRAYSAQSGTRTVHDGLGLLEISVDVPPDEAAATIATLFDLLDKVVKRPPEEVVAWQKKAALTRFAHKTAAAGSRADLLETAAARGIRLDELKDYPARIEAVTPAMVAGLLTDCAGHEAVTVIGPAPEQLAEAGLPVKVVDWQRQGEEIVESLK